METIKNLLGKTNYTFDDLVSIMEILRSEGGCPWDREQTHESIRKNFIEETYEVVDAIDRKDVAGLREELGDVLMQVVFHARMEEEQGRFSVDDVCDEVCRKLIVRHPHVFADTVAEDSDTVLKNWEEIKNQTKGIEKQSESLMAVPAVLPALMRAQKVQGRAAKVGFDFESVQAALDKLEEEIAEVKEALKRKDRNVSEEMGDLLFSAVNVSRLSKVDSEEALYGASEKFIRRFRGMEAMAAEAKTDLKAMSAEEQNALWDKVKEQEGL